MPKHNVVYDSNWNLWIATSPVAGAVGLGQTMEAALSQVMVEEQMCLAKISAGATEAECVVEMLPPLPLEMDDEECPGCEECEPGMGPRKPDPFKGGN